MNRRRGPFKRKHGGATGQRDIPSSWAPGSWVPDRSGGDRLFLRSDILICGKGARKIIRKSSWTPKKKQCLTLPFPDLEIEVGLLEVGQLLVLRSWCWSAQRTRPKWN
jgi:hypothetical protein